MIIDKNLENEFYDNDIYDALQFVKNTTKILSIANYCKDVLDDLISKMKSEHEDWRNSLISELLDQEGAIKKVSLTTDNLPAYKVSVSDIEATAPFLIDKITKDFFQYVRNAFDSMSQIANVALLGTKAKKPDSVDFPAMVKIFNQQTYSQDFPLMCAWYNRVNSSDEFNYIDAFNNRTKHTCDIFLKVSMSLFDDRHSSEINPFFRKDIQHGKQDIAFYLNKIFDFVIDSFDSFMDELKKEYPKRLYITNRFKKLKAHQQNMKSNPESNYAVVYIETEDDIAIMPDEISVLLLNRCEDGEIYSKNCCIDTILVKKSNSENDYLGKYVAAEPCGDDTLLKFRKFQKDSQIGQVVFYCEMLNWRKNPIFYKANPFIDFTTISDDDDFLKRVQLPF